MRYSNAQRKKAFIDSGPKIRVVDSSDASVLAALRLARQKYGKGLVVSGPKEFQDQAIRLAVRNGIGIANPELQERIRKERVQIEAGKEQERETIPFPF